MTLLDLLLPAIAGVMGVECVAMLFQKPERRSRLSPTFLAGMFIVLAWNAAQFGLPAGVVLLALACSLGAHVVDIARRW